MKITLSQWKGRGHHATHVNTLSRETIKQSENVFLISGKRETVVSDPVVDRYFYSEHKLCVTNTRILYLYVSAKESTLLYF